MKATLPKWNIDSVSNAIDQDDLYVDMTFAKVLDVKGLDATTDDFGAMFRDAKYQLWHANLGARRALETRRHSRLSAAARSTTRTPTTSISRSRATSSA